MKINYIYIYALLGFTSILLGQNEQSIYSYNDSILKKENLPISNGLFHYNSFNIVNNQNIYYKQEKYTVGSVNYLNQKYFDLNIKYDAFNDELIFKPNGESEKTGIILYKNNVENFELYDTKFINIEKLELENTKITGYFEEGFSNSEFKYLIKHGKIKKDVLSKSTLQNIFYENETYYVLKNKKIKKISSKGTIKKLFPTKKEIINSYFEDNFILKKSNKLLFYKNLFKKI